MEPLDESKFDINARTQHCIQGARNVGANIFIKPDDIAQGNEKLNLLYAASIFNACSGLDDITEEGLYLKKKKNLCFSLIFSILSIFVDILFFFYYCFFFCSFIMG